MDDSNSSQDQDLTKEQNDKLSLIGEDLIIVGNLTSTGILKIEGEVQGNINCETLLIAETALVKGDIFGENITIRGRVQGTIKGSRLLLQDSCHVEAEIIHKSLVIEQNAYFEGKSRRVNELDSASEEIIEPDQKPIT